MATCPVCKNKEVKLWGVAKDYEYFSSEKSYKYFECNRCHCLFIDPIPADELKLIYPKNYYSFIPRKKNLFTSIKEWLDKKEFKKILRKIKSPQIRVLDIGGGTGWLLDIIKNIDKRVVLTQIVDIDQDAGKSAIAKGHCYYEGKLEDFNTNTRYDFILMLNLIEHVENPLAILQKVSAFLEEKGLVLIKTPNIESWDARLFKKKYWGGLHCPRHWVIFSASSFRKILEDTNLMINSLTYTQGGPFWAFSLLAWLHRKGWIALDAQRPLVCHPLYPYISGITALFDFVRRPFAKTSQMFIVLEKKDNLSTHGSR